MSDEPRLDQTAIERLRRFGGDTLVGEMKELFLQHTPERLERIRAGVASRDAEMVSAAAHSLVSSSAQIGAMSMRDICQQIELKGQEASCNWNDLAKLAAQLDIAFEETRTLLI